MNKDKKKHDTLEVLASYRQLHTDRQIYKHGDSTTDRVCEK